MLTRLELLKDDSSAILVSLGNRSVIQDVTSQFNGSSRILAVAKGWFSDQDTRIYKQIACVNVYVCFPLYAKSIVDSSRQPWHSDWRSWINLRFTAQIGGSMSYALRSSFFSKIISHRNYRKLRYTLLTNLNLSKLIVRSNQLCANTRQLDKALACEK